MLLQPIDYFLLAWFILAAACHDHHVAPATSYAACKTTGAMLSVTTIAKVSPKSWARGRARALYVGGRPFASYTGANARNRG
jgi:hypothetical protein